jgi:thiosulfate reductase cytochrome b subunit
VTARMSGSSLAVLVLITPFAVLTGLGLPSKPSSADGTWDVGPRRANATQTANPKVGVRMSGLSLAALATITPLAMLTGLGLRVGLRQNLFYKKH